MSAKIMMRNQVEDVRLSSLSVVRHPFLSPFTFASSIFTRYDALEVRDDSIGRVVVPKRVTTSGSSDLLRETISRWALVPQPKKCKAPGLLWEAAAPGI